MKMKKAVEIQMKLQPQRNKIVSINTKALFEIQNNIKAENKKVTIIAVTKTRPITSIESAIDNQIYNIGENRVQEAEQKLFNFKKPKKMETHLIGHLQSNKARKAIKLFDYIQTVDRVKLAQKINKVAEEERKIQKIFLQANIGNLEDRGGFLTNEIERAAQKINTYKNLSICGLMIIPPLVDDRKKYTSYFKLAKEIQSRLKKQIKTCQFLSMGMTNDYIDAIKAGATHIRIGTALFGERK